MGGNGGKGKAVERGKYEMGGKWETLEEMYMEIMALGRICPVFKWPFSELNLSLYSEFKHTYSPLNAAALAYPSLSSIANFPVPI